MSLERYIPPSKQLIRVKCGNCSRKFPMRRATHTRCLTENRDVLCPICNTARIVAMNTARVTATCSLCGNQYSAHQLSHDHKARHGVPTYCPTCKRQLTTEGRWRNHAKRQSTQNPGDTHTASCGRTICNTIRNRRNQGPCFRCNLTGQHGYETCLDRASAANWDGWKIVVTPQKENAHGIH